jgi:hypothetical protein
MLLNDDWVDRQTTVEMNRNQNIDQLIKNQLKKINQCKAKMSQVEEGYDGGIYTLAEAKERKES